MKKLLAGAAIAGTLAVSGAGVASAGNGPNANACNGLNNAHMKMIEAQTLVRHVELNVHQVFSTKLLPSACA